MISIDPCPAGLLRSVSRTDQFVCVAADETAEKFVITFVDDDGCDTEPIDVALDLRAQLLKKIGLTAQIVAAPKLLNPSLNTNRA